MTIPDPLSRLVITLDAQIPLDRMVLKQLQSLSGRSRQAWLRSLVVGGFLAECRACQTVRESRAERPSTDLDARSSMPRAAPYAWPSTPRFTGNEKAQAPVRRSEGDDPTTAQSDPKPFAYLRRVIG